MTKRTIKIFKRLLLGIASLLGILALGLVLLYAKRDSIAKDLLIRANKHISGTLEVSDVTIDPLIHFPRTSVTLKGLKLFDFKKEAADLSRIPILELESVSISLDIVQLLRSRLELTELTAAHGKIYLVQGADGIFNWTEALRPPEKRVQLKQRQDSVRKSENAEAGKTTAAPIRKQKYQDPGELQQESIELAIDELHLEHIEMVIDLISNQQRFLIKTSDAAFKSVKDSLEVKLDGQFDIERVGLDTRYEIVDETLGVSLDFFLDQGEEFLSIYQGDIAFHNAHFNVRGIVDYGAGGTVDLRYEAADDQLQFTRLFLSSEGFDNLQSGRLHLRGTVQGPLGEQLPKITCEFGASDVHMEIPKTNTFLRKLNLSGYFESGNLVDLSGATLRLDTLHAVLPNGYLRASSIIKNLKDPSVAYDLDASLRLENLARFIDLGPLDSLAGRIDIKDTYKGNVGGPLGLQMDKRSEPFTILMQDLSFTFPNIVDIQEMTGQLTGTLDSLQIDSLKLRSGESDLKLQGTISGLSGLLIPAEEPVRVDVVLQSSTFDFPHLSRSLPETAEAFPYTIRNLNIDVNAEIVLTDLKDIQYVPEMHYDIRSASGIIEGMLPPVSLKNGLFSTLEKDGSYLLDFKDFKLEIQGYKALVGLAYFGGENGSKSIALSMETDGMNPGSLFYRESDSIPDFLNAEIGGRYKGLLQLPPEEGFLFQSVNIGVEDFDYRGPDTLAIERIGLKTNAISYKAGQLDSLLQTLTATGDIFLQEVETPHFRIDSLEVFVDARQGKFEIVPRNYLGKGKDDFGKIVLEPFLSQPRYQLEYRIKQLRLEEILRSFNQEDILTGAVDLQLRLEAEGNDKEEIAGTLKGTMFLEGKNLILHGLDLDEVITNFSRSQSFNFVDLGAVLLTGPLGVIYTKGFDYYNLVTSDTGDSTKISRFSSRWDVGLGRIASQDVAFATLKNRMAATGWLSTRLDSLDMNLAVIDKRGCAIIDQRIFGDRKSPEYSKLNVIETLLAPVTGAVDDLLGVKCEVFYDGVVRHPEQEN